jgi:hypothetical protein
MLVYARRTSPPASAPQATVEVQRDEFSWTIEGASESNRKVLSAGCALPRVGGAVFATLIADVCKVSGLQASRGAVIERNGRAVAFSGDDWESCITLAAHLHTRGWRFLGGDYGLIDPESLTVRGTRKLLYVTLSCVDELPLTFRGAVEASPWYSTAHDLAFYAVDPSLAGRHDDPWAESGRLSAVLKLDGHVAEYPSLERAGAFSLCEGIDSASLERAGIAVAEVKLGDFVATSDLLERWLEAQLAG